MHSPQLLIQSYGQGVSCIGPARSIAKHDVGVQWRKPAEPTSTRKAAAAIHHWPQQLLAPLAVDAAAGSTNQCDECDSGKDAAISNNCKHMQWCVRLSSGLADTYTRHAQVFAFGSTHACLPYVCATFLITTGCNSPRVHHAVAHTVVGDLEAVCDGCCCCE